MADKPTDMSDWMGQLSPVIRERVPLIQLAIPGSHDSMTYSIQPGAAVAPDVESIIASINRFMPCVVRRWARTQDLNAVDQLRAGIRYFDLRISLHRKDRRFHFVHGLYGDQIYGALVEIEKYLVAHPREFVVLDCQHFYEFADGDYGRLTEELRSVFAGRIYSPADGHLIDLTLNRAEELGKQVLIVFRDDDFRPADFWSSCAWPTPWPNQIRVNRLRESLDRALQQRTFGSGYVTQCVLTPPVHFIVPRFLSSLRHTCAQTVCRKLIAWIREQRPGPYRAGIDAATVNVFIADFVDLNAYEFCRTVIGLNDKLLPASDSAHESQQLQHKAT